MTDQIELLDSVLQKTGRLIGGVTEDQLGLPTPCQKYNVSQLIDHMAGWIQAFASAANGRPFTGDPTSYRHGDDVTREFEREAGDVVAGWREHGFDRTVRMTSEMPASTVFNMTLIEYLTHGWDLARATGQEVPYDDEEAESTLQVASETLPPKYRGEGKPFGDIVPVPDEADATDRLAGFMGRQL